MKFSLATLFGLFSAIAVYLGIVFGMPLGSSMFVLSLVSCLMGPVIVTGVVYGRGYARTFWIGCATSAAIPYLFLLYFTSLYSLSFLSQGNSLNRAGGIGANFSFVVCHVLILSSGFVAVATRRWLIDRERSQPMSTEAVSRRMSVEDLPIPHRDS